MNKKNRTALIVLVSYLALGLLLIFTSSGGEDGLAAVIFVGFGLALLIFVFALRSLTGLFSKTARENQNTDVQIQWQKVGVPVAIALGVNAIMIEGYIGFAGFFNFINALFLAGLFLIFILSKEDKKLKHMLMYAWFSVAAMIVYAFYGYLILGW